MKRYIKCLKSIVLVYTDNMEEFAYETVKDEDEAERVAESYQRGTDRPVDWYWDN